MWQTRAGSTVFLYDPCGAHWNNTGIDWLTQVAVQHCMFMDLCGIHWDDTGILTNGHSYTPAGSTAFHEHLSHQMGNYMWWQLWWLWWFFFYRKMCPLQTLISMDCLLPPVYSSGFVKCYTACWCVTVSISQYASAISMCTTGIHEHCCTACWLTSQCQCCLSVHYRGRKEHCTACWDLSDL